MLLLIIISKQHTVGFTKEKSETRFFLLKELKWRKLRRKHNEANSRVTGMAGPSHIPALLWTKSSHSEACRWTRLLGTSWCNIASKCLWFLGLLCHAVAETSVGRAGKGHWGLGCARLPKHRGAALLKRTAAHPPAVTAAERFLSFRKPSSKNTKLFLQGRKKPQTADWLSTYFNVFLNSFTYS